MILNRNDTNSCLECYLAINLDMIFSKLTTTTMYYILIFRVKLVLVPKDWGILHTFLICNPSIDPEPGKLRCWRGGTPSVPYLLHISSLVLGFTQPPWIFGYFTNFSFFPSCVITHYSSSDFSFLFSLSLQALLFPPLSFLLASSLTTHPCSKAKFLTGCGIPRQAPSLGTTHTKPQSIRPLNIE